MWDGFSLGNFFVEAGSVMMVQHKFNFDRKRGFTLLLAVPWLFNGSKE